MDKHIWYTIEMKYLATKSNKVIIHATTWMNLKDIMLTDTKYNLLYDSIHGTFQNREIYIEDKLVAA